MQDPKTTLWGLAGAIVSAVADVLATGEITLPGVLRAVAIAGVGWAAKDAR